MYLPKRDVFTTFWDLTLNLEGESNRKFRLLSLFYKKDLIAEAISEIHQKQSYDLYLKSNLGKFKSGKCCKL